MSFYVRRQAGLETLGSDLLHDTAHCFTTRPGGGSTGALAGLNLGMHRGDAPGQVLENYRILGEVIGFRPEQTVFSRQTHSDVVERVGRADCGRGLLREVEHPCDALITNEPGVALTVFSADCTPILLYDPVQRAIGAVHSGWRGTAAGIVARTVEAMVTAFGSVPSELCAAIGPCIGACCFETDADVPEALRRTLGEQADAAIRCTGSKYHVDLKALNALWLHRAGVCQVDVSTDCTACQPQRFWSHRRMGNARGSMAAIIMLKGAAR